MDTQEKVIAATKAAVEALGSQRNLAKFLNVHESTVSYWMKGEKCSLEAYFRLMEIAKPAKTPAVNVLAACIAASVLIFFPQSESSASKTQTAGECHPAVYYVKFLRGLLSRLLRGYAALPALRAS